MDGAVLVDGGAVVDDAAAVGKAVTMREAVMVDEAAGDTGATIDEGAVVDKAAVDEMATNEGVAAAEGVTAVDEAADDKVVGMGDAGTVGNEAGAEGGGQDEIARGSASLNGEAARGSAAAVNGAILNETTDVGGITTMGCADVALAVTGAVDDVDVAAAVCAGFEGIVVGAGGVSGVASMLSSSIRSSGASVYAVSVICAMYTSLCMASKRRDSDVCSGASRWKVAGIGGLAGGGKALGESVG
jgi:hypothetical protein